MVCHDRGTSAFTGRPRALQDDEYVKAHRKPNHTSLTVARFSFDLDPPIECDDEYWENQDPDKAWKQPPGKPSSMAYFNQFLKLGDVLGHALRTIVCPTLQMVTYWFLTVAH
jgi:hypothetical protein